MRLQTDTAESGIIFNILQRQKDATLRLHPWMLSLLEQILKPNLYQRSSFFEKHVGQLASCFFRANQIATCT